MSARWFCEGQKNFDMDLKETKQLGWMSHDWFKMVLMMASPGSNIRAGQERATKIFVLIGLNLGIKLLKV